MMNTIGSTGAEPLATLRTQTGFRRSHRTGTATPIMRLSIGGEPVINDIKPQVLESKISEDQRFL